MYAAEARSYFVQPVPGEDADFHRKTLTALSAENVRFLVGGGYAMRHYTGIVRKTKDLDLFVHAAEIETVMAVLERAGYRTELTFPHWLGKAFQGEAFVDVIFSSGNGVAIVDDDWFHFAEEADVLGFTTRVAPVEEMIWSKAFILERERYDGADVAHLLRARARHLDWHRLVQRFGRHWRVLLSHLVLFGFIYPGQRTDIPREVLDALMCRMREESGDAPVEQLCQGTLLSREQYLTDVQQWGYQDARLKDDVRMTPEDIAHWTQAIAQPAGADIPKEQPAPEPTDRSPHAADAPIELKEIKPHDRRYR